MKNLHDIEDRVPRRPLPWERYRVSAWQEWVRDARWDTIFPAPQQVEGTFVDYDALRDTTRTETIVQRLARRATELRLRNRNTDDLALVLTRAEYEAYYAWRANRHWLDPIPDRASLMRFDGIRLVVE